MKTVVISFVLAQLVVIVFVLHLLQGGGAVACGWRLDDEDARFLKRTRHHSLFCELQQSDMREDRFSVSS